MLLPLFFWLSLVNFLAKFDCVSRTRWNCLCANDWLLINPRTELVCLGLTSSVWITLRVNLVVAQRCRHRCAVVIALEKWGVLVVFYLLWGAAANGLDVEYLLRWRLWGLCCFLFWLSVIKVGIIFNIFLLCWNNVNVLLQILFGGYGGFRLLFKWSFWDCESGKFLKRWII